MADMLSQDEIDELLNGNSSVGNGIDDGYKDELSAHEISALNEISNISMMDCGSVLFKLVGKKSSFGTPQIEVVAWEDLKQNIGSIYGEQDFVGVSIEYTEGLSGINLFTFGLNDAGVIADLMMSGEGNSASEQLSDLHISAINEAMNQMIGSSATAISSMISKTIRVATPKTSVLQLDTFNIGDFFTQKESFVKITFKMNVEGLIDSSVVQVVPVSFAKLLVENLISAGDSASEVAGVLNDDDLVDVQTKPSADMNSRAVSTDAQDAKVSKQKENTTVSVPKKSQVNVQPVQFQTFEDAKVPVEKESMDLVKDIPLLVTVELGRTQKLIRHILEFGQGTIIELDKLAGEPVDILVNGKFIAKGEVVVIDENFGVRITDIVHPSKRL